MSLYARGMRSCALVLALGVGACNADPPPPPRPRPGAITPAAPAPPACTAHEHVCRGDELVECGADGAFGATLQVCKDGCRNGACADACAAQGVELVYVLTEDSQLLSFDPQKLPGDPFHRIGAPACGLSSPNSMAVDHSGIAWVVDHQRGLYRVSIVDAHCSPAGSPSGTAVPSTFGMGFASDGKRTPGATAETLYVASDETSGEQPSVLGRLDTTVTPAAYTAIAPISARGKWNPEFSGTGAGDLFGYFPLKERGGFIQEVDRATGQARGPRWPVPSDSEITAWAFAQWGGVFYVFATTSDGNSQVHAIHRKSGEHALVREHLPYKIIGAGVSTCAPELERAAP